MPAHNASKTRVNALTSRASTSFLFGEQDVDGRDKPAMTPWRCRVHLVTLL